MRYTIRHVPAKVDEALRRRAREQGKSLNEVAVEALIEAVRLAPVPAPRRDLADIAGTWRDDPAVEGALADQRAIDEDRWK